MTAECTQAILQSWQGVKKTMLSCRSGLALLPQLPKGACGDASPSQHRKKEERTAMNLRKEKLGKEETWVGTCWQFLIKCKPHCRQYAKSQHSFLCLQVGQNSAGDRSCEGVRLGCFRGTSMAQAGSDNWVPW